MAGEAAAYAIGPAMVGPSIAVAIRDLITYVRDTPLACFPPLARDDFAGKVERVAAAKQSLVAGALSVPAALVTYNTIRPAVAALTETWPSF